VTDDETLTLLMVALSPAPVGCGVIGQGLADRPLGMPGLRRLGRRAAQNLADQGALEQLAAPSGARQTGRWVATEKGKIAAALVIGKNPDLREVFIDAWGDLSSLRLGGNALPARLD